MPRLPFATLFHWLGAPARWLASALKPRLSIFSGSTLALLSLFLVTSVQFGCSNTEYRGYQVLTGEASWLTAENMENKYAAHFVIRYTGWALYAVALVIAVSGFGLLASFHHEKLSPRLVKILTVCSAIVALFTISDLVFWFVPFILTDTDNGLGTGTTLVLWYVYWLVPSLLGLRLLLERRKQLPGLMPASAVPVLAVLFLPVMFLSFGILMLIAADAPGFVAFYLGILALWWGHAQLAATLDNRVLSDPSGAGSLSMETRQPGLQQPR